MHELIRLLTYGRGFYPGVIFEKAASKYPDLQVTLDQPLFLAPERGTEFTSTEIADLVDDTAARLWAAGVRPTERVAIYHKHSFDIALLACASARIGAVPALLAPPLDGDIAFTLLHRLSSPWLITDGDTLQRKLGEFAVSETTRGILLSSGEPAAGAIPLAGLDGAPRRDPVLLHPSQPSLITHSSGTTGLPKLAVQTPEAGFHRLSLQQAAAWAIRGRETAAMCITFAHSRFYQGLGMWLSLGNSLVIATDHDSVRMAPLLVKTRPGYLETHPNTFIEWESLATAHNEPLASVQVFGATFDAMHPRTIQRMLSGSRRRNPLFVQAYGQTETGPVAGRWYTRRTAHKADGRCVGLPAPGFVSMRVVDDQGRKLSAGQPGYLEVRTRSRVLTYLGEDARYQSQLHRGWWRMGDMGYLDRWGLLHLLDREVDQISSIDSNLEVEDILMSRLKNLREIVIIAGPHGEPVPVVATVDDLPVNHDQWAAATSDLPIMAPVRQLAFHDFPRTSTWKIQRHQIAERLRRESAAHPPVVPTTPNGLST